MNGDLITDNVRRFLSANIASVPHLEALLLLAADPVPKRVWTASEVAAGLYLKENLAHGLLTELCGLDLLSCGPEVAPGFVYAPTTPEIAKVVIAVHAAYRGQLIEVTRLIHLRSGRKALQFADAFRWRKE